MSETLYATYADPNRARKAAEQLLSLGVEEAEISLLVKHDDKMRDSREGVDLADTRPTTPMRGTEFQITDDPLGNNLRQSSVPQIERGLDVELNPAQNDYSVTHPRSVEDFSSVQPSQESLEATPYEDMPGSHSLRFSRGYNAVGDMSPEDVKVDPDADGYRDTDTHLNPSAHDVAHGAAQGAGIGLGIGAVAALASFLIPGLGLVVGGGALATAAATLVTGTGVGALAGGMAGLLRESGVPEESVNRYATTYDSGGAVLAVTVTNPAMRASIEQTLRTNGPLELETHQAYLA
jgi:hypothetical protein